MLILMGLGEKGWPLGVGLLTRTAHSCKEYDAHPNDARSRDDDVDQHVSTAGLRRGRGR